jgi:hypothetical protein
LNDENGGIPITESVDNVETESTTIEYESINEGVNDEYEGINEGVNDEYESINEGVNDVEELNQDDSVSTKRPSSTNQFTKGPHKRIRTKENTTTFKSNCESEEKNSKSKQTGEVFIFLGPDNEDIPLIRFD